MPRLAVELLATTAVALAITTMVLCGGRAAFSPSTPPTSSNLAGMGLSCHNAPVHTLAVSTVEGHAQLCVGKAGVRPAVQLGGLRSGEVYTAWLAYFERPAACLTRPCQLIDLLGDNPLGVLGRIDGAVASAHELHLQAEIRDLRVAGGAEVILLIFGHGGANAESGRALARQLLSLQTPEFGVPLAGAIADGGRA